CGGAFESLEKIVAHRVNKGGMGFGADVRSEDEFSNGELFKQLEPDDLIHFGLIPELVGRLPITVALDELDAPALLRILTEPKNALVKQYKKLFDMDGIKLDFTDDALSEIVAAAIARKTGARGLRSVIERALEKPMFELPGSGTKKFTLTADMVRRGNVDPDAAQKKKKDV
ncbi:MAG: ATP-dependent Clp protease ATP-binding subunit ClpX, partial [Fibrobacteraceae bacterium]